MTTRRASSTRARRYCRAGLFAAFLLAAFLAPHSVASAAPQCFGRAATVTGSGTVLGTPGDDVIVGGPMDYREGAIAGNYLNRVKGPRPVGAKVFLQGGVALNFIVHLTCFVRRQEAAFNEKAHTFNTSVLTNANDATLQKFNPVAGDVPVEGVHWKKGPLFGLPTSATTLDSAGSFQTPRTYRVSFVLRY